jgi:hypothetical protein
LEKSNVLEGVVIGLRRKSKSKIGMRRTKGKEVRPTVVKMKRMWYGN